MTIQWCVAVAVSGPGNLYLAAGEAIARNFEICVPEKFMRKRTTSNRSERVFEPLMSPYFFAGFDLLDQEQEALFRSLRGVETILTRWSRNEDRSVPQPIDPAVIGEHERRMFQERRDATHNWKRSRSDLRLGKTHRIVRHPNFAGKEGTLVAVALGWAHMRVGPWLIKVPELDVVAVERTAA